MARPILQQNWLTTDDITNLLALEGYEAFRTFSDLLLPIKIPVLSSFTNRFLAKLWPFNLFNLTNFIIARPLRNEDLGHEKLDVEPTVSVVVAARNERGNIENIFRRVPKLGSDSEIVFVEGGSKDDTYEEIERCISEYSTIRSSVYKQAGKGKGDAVRLGFEKASGDVLMILDADLTMPPEELPKYYDALVSGKGEFINGVRLVYPMENQAMRFFNLLGNKFFSLAFSWILGQPIKDTLCGTKVLRKRDYEMIAANRSYFGEFDPFGDFDLIFGAARLNLKMVDLPIRYRDRTYGDTNISRWSHGWLLLKMVLFATKKIKFR
jgi:glycosyltransferase involved in cell wall biosynthesis